MNIQTAQGIYFPLVVLRGWLSVQVRAGRMSFSGHAHNDNTPCYA